MKNNPKFKPDPDLKLMAQVRQVFGFLFREVLDIAINQEIAPIKAKKYPRPPVVMTQNEVQSVLMRCRVHIY